MLIADDPSLTAREAHPRHPKFEGSLWRSNSEIVSCWNFSWFSFVLLLRFWCISLLHRFGPTARRSDVERVFRNLRNSARLFRMSLSVLFTVMRPEIHVAERSPHRNQPCSSWVTWRISVNPEDDPFIFIKWWLNGWTIMNYPIYNQTRSD